jgi:sec-independent protein translocase protein TatA
MFGFGVPELLIIGAIMMLIFGVGRLPELGSSFGRAISNFRKAADGKDQIEINPKAEN